MMRRDEPQLERLVDQRAGRPLPVRRNPELYAKWFATKDLTVPLNQFLKEAFVDSQHLSCVAVSFFDRA